MTINLLTEMARYLPREDHESSHAWFRTLVPWVAPEAYLHIIFKPPRRALIDTVDSRLRFPRSVLDLFAVQNGARLFTGAIWLDGIVEEGQLLDRTGSFGLLPVDIAESNAIRHFDGARYLIIGGYRYDGSRVCVDRVTGQVGIKQRGEPNVRDTWPNVERWLLDELERIGRQFTDDGHFIGTSEGLAPPSL